MYYETTERLVQTALTLLTDMELENDFRTNPFRTLNLVEIIVKNKVLELDDICLLQNASDMASLEIDRLRLN